MSVLEAIGSSRRLPLALDIRWERRTLNERTSLLTYDQVPFADAIKKSHPDIAVGAVGLITEGPQAESYLQEGKADVIFLGRALLKDPHWALNAAKALNVPIKAANQYERAGI